MTLQDFNAGSEVTTALLHELIATVIRLDRTALRNANWPLKAVGQSVLWDKPSEDSVFPVLVIYDSGTMGDAEHPCAALYRVKTLDGTRYLGGTEPGGTPGLAIASAMARPVNWMTANPADGAAYDGTGAHCPKYGWGCYDPTATTPDHFVLLWAGEMPNFGGTFS